MKTVPADIIAAAQAADRKWGVFASVSLGQWALESEWGVKATGRFNTFGIKATLNQPGTWCETHEVFGGVRTLTRARFRDFTSVADAFDAHACLIATGRNARGELIYGAAMAHKGDLAAFVPALAAHYATDPHYSDKLLELIREEGFTRYDGVAPASSKPAPTLGQLSTTYGADGTRRALET